MAILKNATQQQLADALQISQAEVSRLIQKGYLSKRASVGQWLIEYGRHMRDLAAGWKSEDGDLDLIHERARLAARQSEKLEIDTAKLRGDLFPKQTVIKVLGFQYTNIRSKLLTIPARIKAQRPELEIDAIIALKGLIDETLIELTHIQLPGDIVEGVQRYYHDLHTATKPDGNGMGG